MELPDYAVIFAAYLVASAIKGLTGIGFSTSCLPILALHFDLKTAIPLVILPSIISNVAVMVQSGHFNDAVKRFWPLYLANIPGLIIGLSILVMIASGSARLILGMILILYALWALCNATVVLGSLWERRLKVPVGFLNGLINGVTGSQVMPALPYLLSLQLDKNLFVQASNISFTLSSLVMLLGMNQLGLLSLQTFIIALVGLIPILFTVYYVGKWQQRHLSGSRHRQLVLGFLLVMGVTLIARVIF